MANVAVDRARRRSRHALWAATALVPDRLEDHQDPTVLRLGLVSALGALPRRQREVVVLRYLCGLSETDVAGVTGISINSVKKHTSRAMVRLRAGCGRTLEEMDLAF